MRKRCFSLIPVRRLAAKKVRDGSSSESDDDSPPTQSQSSHLCLNPEQKKELDDLDPSSSPLKIDDFLSFLEEENDSKNPGLVALKYSENINRILVMIDALRKSSTDKKLQAKRKGLKKKLKKHFEIP